MPNSEKVERTSINQLDCHSQPYTPARSPAIGSVGEINTNTKPNFSGKRRKRDEAPSPMDMAILAELSREKDDEDILCVKSLVPQLKRLNDKKKLCKVQNSTTAIQSRAQKKLSRIVIVQEE